MQEILRMSGLQIAKLIRDKKLSSVDAVETHIEQIEKANPTLNAVVAERFDQAREEARAADRKLRKGGKLPAYHGVPCSIKECFALEGMPNAAGLVSRKDIRSEKDATAVARLRKGGAIPLGVTNTSELCMWMETNNTLYGRTNNPYDHRRIVGGSSGGEGAIIAAGGAPFGLGSDVGGSIRMPAFFNGIFGHKPSGGVPNSGQYPIAKGLALRYLTTGPLCKKGEDLYPLMKLLIGPDGIDDECMTMPLKDPANVSLDDLNVVVVDSVRSPIVNRVSRDLREAQWRAARALEARGALVSRVRIKLLKQAFDIWSSMLYEGNEVSFRDMMADGRRVSFLWEIMKATIGKSDFTLPGSILALVEEQPGWTPKRTRKLIERGMQLRAILHELIGNNGVMLFLSYTAAAPRHRRPLLPPTNWIYTGIMNVMELPVTQVPLGLNKKGVPLGVQVVSIHGHDHYCLAIARELEKSFGGWVPPSRWLD